MWNRLSQNSLSSSILYYYQHLRRKLFWDEQQSQNLPYNRGKHMWIKNEWKKILPVNITGKTWDAQYIAKVTILVFNSLTSTEKPTYLIDPSWGVVFHIRGISDKYHLFRKQSWKCFIKGLFISVNIKKNICFIIVTHNFIFIFLKKLGFVS